MPDMLYPSKQGSVSARLLCAAVAVLSLAVARPSAAQSLAWAVPFGTDKYEQPTDAAADGAGGFYMCGHDFSGPGWAGDAWVMRYDAAGTQMWIRYLGTPLVHDGALAVAPDGSAGVWVSGQMDGQALLARFDGAGNLLWSHQLSSGVHDQSEGTASDGAGGVYFSGSTLGDLGGPNAGGSDAWVARYDGAGNQVWIRQLGSAGDESQVVALADGAGGVYLFGNTTGTLGATSLGMTDVWVAHYDGAGNSSWLSQYGSPGHDFLEDAASDPDGRLFACGRTQGPFGGPYTGLQDAWLARFDGQGNPTWIRQLGVREAAYAVALAADGLGGVYLSGAEQSAIDSSKRRPWLAHFNGDGLPTWMQRIGHIGLLPFSAAAPDETGGVFVGVSGPQSVVARYW